MKYSIKHLLHIDASKENVFEAITTINGFRNWWSVESSGDASLNGILQFRFNGIGPDFKVIDIRPNEKVMFECVDSPHGWLGQTLVFQLDENEGKTRVRFSHNGWHEQGDYYSNCTFSWGRYLESLRQYCLTGIGKAFGSENY